MDPRPLLSDPPPPEPSPSPPPASAPYKPPPPPPPAPTPAEGRQGGVEQDSGGPVPSNKLQGTSAPTAAAPYKLPPPPPTTTTKTPAGARQEGAEQDSGGPVPSNKLKGTNPPPASAPYEPVAPPPPPPASPSTKTPAGAGEQQVGGGITGDPTASIESRSRDQAPRAPLPQHDSPTKSPGAARSRSKDTSGGGTTSDKDIGQDNLEPGLPGRRTSDPAANGFIASPTATMVPPAARSSLEADGRSMSDESELENGGARGRSSWTNAQDPPPPPAAATLHTSAHAVGSRNNSLLPVTNPPPRRENGTSFRELWESCISDLLPDGVVQLRVAVCGFSLYGIMSLLGSTQGLVKNFSPNHQVLVLVGIGFIWAVTSIAVGVTMSARTRFGRALSQHGTRLALVGITALVLFHIIGALPQNFWRQEGVAINIWSAVGTVFLIVLVSIGHAASWAVSGIYGETERKPAQDGS